MAKTRRLLVAGLARNVEAVLHQEVFRLETTTRTYYDEVDFHIVESDSSDHTGKTLELVSSKIRGFSFERLGNLQREIPDRINRLRYCRNRYIDFYRASRKPYSEVLVVDFDIQNRRFKPSVLKRVLDEDLTWDVIFANQTGRYFDIYALRERTWCPRDCMVEIDEMVKAGISRTSAKEIAIWGRMRKISRNSKVIEVDSAFGGMAIYKSWIFDEFDYSIESTPITPIESEHVAFHYKAKNAGGRLFIHPRLTNFAWNPHNLASFKVLRKLDQISNSIHLKGFRRRLRGLLG